MVKCNKCNRQRGDGDYCPSCGWNNKLPEIGGYDPELDYDG